MSFLRNSQLALNCQAVNSGVWHTLTVDDVEIIDGPKFRIQLFSEQANDRYRAALNAARNKNSPYFAYRENDSVWNLYMKHCLSEFGIKDWEGITKIDTMSEKEISNRTIDFIKEEIDPLMGKLKQTKTELKLPSGFIKENFCAGKDGILQKEGESIYFHQIIDLLSEECPDLTDLGPFLDSVDKLSKFFETEVPCTHKNISAFLEQPRNSLGFGFCVKSAFNDKPFRVV